MSPVFAKPRSILVIRPDTYGDIILTIPLLGALRERLPETETIFLIRRAFSDVAPLLPEGVRVVLTGINPYAGLLPPNDAALVELGKTLEDLQPDCLIAPCFSGTWLERWVAARLPAARRIGVGAEPFDPLTLLSAESMGHPTWNDDVLFPERVPVERNSLDRAKSD